MEGERITYSGNNERYQKWEREPIELVSILETLGRKFNLPKSLQKIEGDSLTPEKMIDIDDRALRSPNCPNVVFGRPHAGEFMPEPLVNRINPEAAKTLVIVDRGTQLFFRDEKIPSVGTRLSRFFIDPNRIPLPNAVPENSKAPGKVLWKEGVYGEKIYQEGMEPSDQEINNLVERTYLPYYNGMMGVIGSLTDRRKSDTERILVVDGHSFMTQPEFNFFWKIYGLDNADQLPLIILGDKDGQGCDRDIREGFITALENNFRKLSVEDQEFLMRNSKSKRLVGSNEYLRGVHNVAFYGQRDQGVNCLQMELNESAYTDGNDYYNSQYNERGLTIMKKLIKDSCLAIDPILKGK